MRTSTALRDGSAPPDLRLVPAAAAVWGIVLVALAGGPIAAVVAVAGATGIAAFAGLVVRGSDRAHGVDRAHGPDRADRAHGADRTDRTDRTDRRDGVDRMHRVAPRGSARAQRRGPVGSRRWPAGVLAAAGCAAAAGAVVTLQVVHVTGHPLGEPALRGAAATLEVTVRDDPRPVRAKTAGAARPLLVVPAVLRAAEVGDDRWTSGGRVLLLAPADGWAALLPGQQVTAAGLLAPPDRADLTIAVLRVRGPPSAVGPPPWWQSAAGTLRAGLRTAATATLDEAPAGLLPGLAVGDTSGLPEEVQADFRAAGLTHLTAVSGANLAIVGGAVLGLLRLLRADPRAAAVASGLAVLGFVVLARPSPSVLRAAVMGGVVLLALALGRSRSAVPALAAAVIALLIADPALGVDPGFALSVLATAALVLVAPGWAAALRARGVPAGAAEALVVPAAAALATAPVIAGISGEISLVTVLANLLAAPAVAPATVLGVLAAVVSPIAPPLAEGCAWVAGPVVGWLVALADHAAALPGAVVPWPSGTPGALLLVVVLAGALAVLRAPRSRGPALAALLGLLLVLVPTRVAPLGWPPSGWAVVACDVGQGDALVLATGVTGHAVLVDAGPDPGAVDACLDRLGVHTLALLALSHLHADHTGGLTGALRGRVVAGVAVGPVREPRAALAEVARRAAAAGVPLVALTAGARLQWPALVLDVLGPVHPATSVDPDDGSAVNDGSLVLRAATPAGTVLLTGDAELAAQADLLGSGRDLRADVLKMPHHGSGTTSGEFLDVVAPRAVLVSVGRDNPYGHPDPRLVTALEQAGATVRRTDLAGDVALTTPGPRLVTRGAAAADRRRRGGPGRAGSRPPGPGVGRGPVSGGRGPPARRRWWRARSRWVRPGRTPRRGSSGRRR